MKGPAVMLAVLVTSVAWLAACDRRESTLKGERNVAITFFGKTVDQDGKPLQNVRVIYQSEAFPENWSWRRRGEPLVVTKVEAVSGADGCFSFTATTHVLRRVDVIGPPGYRHFFEEYAGGLPNRVVPSTYGYLVISSGDLCFKSDPENPAVFVFVKDGVKEVSALPCTGGSESPNGTHWFRNTPAWPVKPSLKDVVQVQPATMP